MQSSLSDKRFKLVFAAWWTIWSVVHVIVLLNFGLTDIQALTDSIVSNLLLVASCLLININLRYYLPRQERFWYILATGIVLSMIWLFLIRMILGFVFNSDAKYVLMLSQSSVIRFAVAFLLSGCMAMMSMLWYSQKEQQEMKERKADAERLAREAELFKLRQQLQPHFLFNSLNSISALTGTQPEKARHMIQQLSDFLRGTLRKDEQHWSTLKEELEYLQLYLDIEKVRFGYRLQTVVVCDEDVAEMKLPSLLLQPVVENAIKFGLYDTVGNVLITIAAKNKDGMLEVSVTNPFDKETSQPLQGTGFGLASIKRRLYLLFSRHDLLQTTDGNEQFITIILIPQLQ